MPAPSSDALLERTLSEAARLAESAPEKDLDRANSLISVANAYAAADRPADARRFYLAAVASAVRVQGQDVRNVFRDVARGQVQVRDDAQAAKTAALSRDAELAREVNFLIARRDAPADSPLRKQYEDEAFRTWKMQSPEASSLWDAQRKQMRSALLAALDDSNMEVSRRVGAFFQLLELDSEKRSTTTSRYLPALSEAARKVSDPVSRANALNILAQIHHQIGDTTAAQAALTEAVEAAALIPDAEERFRQLRSLLANGAPSARTPENRGTPSLPPLTLPEQFRQRATTLALSALESLIKSQPGEAPDRFIQRLINAANHGIDVTSPPFTPAVLLGMMNRAVAAAKGIPAGQREVSLNFIGMVQSRAGNPDAVIETLRLSTDRSWRVSTLLDLAWVGVPSFRSPAEQAIQKARLVDVARAEARALPVGPARYQALVTVLRATLTKLKTDETAQSRALYREIVALIPVGTGPLPQSWTRDGTAPGQVLLRLAHLGQRVGEHQTARSLLARASAITIKAPTDAPPGAAFLFSSIARAQAFSADFNGAKGTLKAALAYQARLHYFDEQSKGAAPGRMRAGGAMSLAAEQAAIRDFEGALATVTAHIPIRFAGERSRALSAIACEMVAARKGKPIPPYSDYVL